MSLAKVIEVLAEGNTIEQAVENSIQEASKSVEDIKHVYVKDFQAIVENNKVVKYRVNAKITFVVHN
jgi:dodecin